MQLQLTRISVSLKHPHRRSILMGAAENDRKHDDLCVGSTGIRPMDQQRTS